MIKNSLEHNYIEATKDEVKLDIIESILEISYHAIAAIEHPQTIRVLRNFWKNKDIMVLIDGRNTYNFINQSIVSKFRLLVVRNTKFQIMTQNHHHTSMYH